MKSPFFNKINHVESVYYIFPEDKSKRPAKLFAVLYEDLPVLGQP